MPAAPTLVLGHQPHFVLTIAESLARRGIEVHAATSHSEAPLRASRWLAAVHATPDPLADTQGFRERLGHILETTHCDWVVASSDSTLAGLMASYDVVSAVATPGIPPPEISRAALRKDLTFSVALELGLPVPTELVVKSVDDARALPPDAFPLVAKGRDKSQMLRIPEKVLFVASLDELIVLFERPGFPELYVLQRMHRGDDVAVGVLMHDDSPVMMTQDRRVKQYQGVSIVAVTEKLDPRLADWSVTLLRALEWEGAAMVEFKHDRQTDEICFLEMNGRYWGTLATNVSAGADFPWCHWQIDHGESPGVATYSPGVRTRWLAGDIERLSHAMFRPHALGLPPPRRLGEIVRFLTDFRPLTRIVPLSFGDPLPFFIEVGRAIIRIAFGELRRGATRIRHAVWRRRPSGAKSRP